MVFGCGLLQSEELKTDYIEIISGEIIIRFHDHVTDEMIQKFVLKYSQYELEIVPRMSPKIFNHDLFTYNSNLVDDDHILQLIKNESIVKRAYLNFNSIRSLEQYIPSDQDFGLQWPLQNVGQTVNGATGTPGADISATYAWSVLNNHQGNTRTKVIVVIDSGFLNFNVLYGNR